ncbi:hypothetical protein JQC92_20240 [Shewanella sp. 202IG2-18]|uniref:hypothetical protein n=1 Tax=Parashewanella hymeniacidonis TaxID=2807618 RepID=UPI001962176C|nr:hypothetical protein [Parashewanella hymeniacidonis]MBM7074324.1 hypothetical protein [Parashewanella hymeniacidonis]
MTISLMLRPWLTFDALKGASSQQKNVLIVASETMALPVGAHQYLENSGDNVKAVWLEGATQFDFYDVPQYVNKAAVLVAEHFQDN